MSKSKVFWWFLISLSLFVSFQGSGIEIEQFPVSVPDGIYTFQVRHSNQVMDVANYSMESKANVQQWWSIAALNQKWVVTHVNDGYYSIKALHSGMALDVAGSSSEIGTSVIQYVPNASDSQLWGIVSAGNGYYKIVSRMNPLMCLDVSNVSNEGGANIQLWEYIDFHNQHWFLIPASAETPELQDGKYIITAKHSGKALNVTDASMDDTANIDQYSLNGGDNQKWVVERQGYGFYRIKALHSSKVVDVMGGIPENGRNVWQYTWLHNHAQLWKIVDVGGGYYKIVSGLDLGKCLDVEDFSLADGANVQLWDYHGGDNQKWQFTPTDPEDPGIKIVPDPPAADSPFKVEVTGSKDYANVNLVIYDTYDIPVGGVEYINAIPHEDGTVTWYYEVPAGLEAGMYNAVFTADNFVTNVCSRLFEVKSIPPGAQITWHTPGVSRKLGDGAVNPPLKVRFESNVDLPAVSIKASPEIAPFILFNSGTITNMKKEIVHEIDLVFRVPADAREGLFQGTLSLFAGAKKIPVPYPISLEVDYGSIELHCEVIKLADETLDMLKSIYYFNNNSSVSSPGFYIRLEFLPGAPHIADLNEGDIITAPPHVLAPYGFACGIISIMYTDSSVIIVAEMVEIDDIVQEGSIDFNIPLLNDSFTIEALNIDDCIKAGTDVEYSLHMDFFMNVQGECSEPADMDTLLISFNGHVTIRPFFEGLAEKKYEFEKDLWQMLKDQGKLSFLEFEIPISVAGIPFTICVSPYLTLSGEGTVKAEIRAETELTRDFTITMGYSDGSWGISEPRIFPDDRALSVNARAGVDAKVNFDVGLKSQIVPGAGGAAAGIKKPITEVLTSLKYEVGPYVYLKNTLHLKAEFNPQDKILDCGLYYKAWLVPGLKVKNKFFDLIDHKEEIKIAERLLKDCSTATCFSRFELWKAHPDRTFGKALEDGTFEPIIFEAPCNASNDIQDVRSPDLNGDNLDDILIISHSDYVVPLLSTGDGTFDYDINNDGTFDLTNDVFSPWDGYHMDPEHMFIADVNGDSMDDLIYPVHDNDGKIHTWFSNGDGTFTVERFKPGWKDDKPYPIKWGPWLVGDINGDGKSDLVNPMIDMPGSTLYDNSYIYTFISHGDGTFQRVKEDETKPGRGYFFIMDANHDGFDDVIQLREGDHQCRVWYSKGNGRYEISYFENHVPIYEPDAHGKWFVMEDSLENDHLVYIDYDGSIMFFQYTRDGFHRTHESVGYPGYGVQHGKWAVQDNARGIGDQLFHYWNKNTINVWNFNFWSHSYSKRSFTPWDTFTMKGHPWIGLDFDGDGIKDILHIDSQ